jgi:outer membrane protein OmpA-like peptidoglycan-associated protein
MKILTSLVVVAALSGCAYQSGYIAPDGAWVAKGEPYAKGPAGPAGPVGLVGVADPAGAAGVSGWSSMENVNFKYGSSDPQQKCKDKLATFAAWMQNNPQARVSLDGHQSEADDTSQALAAQRVTAVRDELIRLGASPSRIVVGAYGRQVPVCNQPTDTCLELNRRVEILAVRS